MMKKFLQKILYKPVLYITNKYSSKPDKERINKALTDLYAEVKKGNEKKGMSLELDGKSYIIFSDQHKGAKDGSDDFALAEKNYLAALDYYNEKAYTFVSLGDAEELWENTWLSVKKCNTENFQAEKKFIERNAFIKVFGNHDIFWGNDPLAGFHLKNVYKQEVKVYEAVLLKSSKNGLDIFLTHGHQGDGQSDNNAFSAWFISNIWAPLQSFLAINFNTPAYDASRKTLHNQMMYEWSASQKCLLPVFESLTYIERLNRSLELHKKENRSEDIMVLQGKIKQAWGKEPPQLITNIDMQPSYFNSGCCCYSDGEITGIEISDGEIRLIEWKNKADSPPERVVLEANSLEKLTEKVRQPLSLNH
jgi:UDP-2,3-diacylglucosamine pyrophosphatase LpxH